MLDTFDLDFLCEIVQELLDIGLAPSVRNIASYLVPKYRDAAIANALQTLVAQGRLVRVPALLSLGGDDQISDLDYYYPSPHET